MDRSSVISLISETKTKNEYGVYQTTTSSRDVFCQVNSVSRSEFFEAGRNGLNPEYEFTMFAGDYNGERIVGYNGDTYAVYRTYFGRNDTIELYVERQGGAIGKTPAPTPPVTTPSETVGGEVSDGEGN